jgi:hypothetical protein
MIGIALARRREKVGDERQQSGSWVGERTIAIDGFSRQRLAQLSFRMPRTLPPLKTSRFFEVAARYLNFTHTAQEMQVTHGAVSQRIKRLEEHLGKSGAAADACC